jgi:hypothetical protein
MPTNARFAKASLWVNPDSLKKFFAGHRKYLTVFISVSKPQQAGSVSPTKFFGKMPKPARWKRALPGKIGATGRHALP